MAYNEILQIIKDRLGDNYVASQSNILESIIKEKIFQAESISNRDININDATHADNNLKLLSPEIIEASIISYEQRGVEYTRSQSELGTSNSFIDVDELLRNNIIKHGKRVIF